MAKRDTVSQVMTARGRQEEVTASLTLQCKKRSASNLLKHWRRNRLVPVVEVVALPEAGHHVASDSCTRKAGSSGSNPKNIVQARPPNKPLGSAPGVPTLIQWVPADWTCSPRAHPVSGRIVCRTTGLALCAHTEPVGPCVSALRCVYFGPGTRTMPLVRPPVEKARNPHQGKAHTTRESTRTTRRHPRQTSDAHTRQGTMDTLGPRTPLMRSDQCLRAKRNKLLWCTQEETGQGTLAFLVPPPAR